MEQKKQAMIFLAGELRNDKKILSLIANEEFDFYAADAGYILAKKFKVPLREVLGDFDSMEQPDVEGLRLYPSEKDQTDSEIALGLAIEHGHGDIIMVAPFGGRLDHTVANLCLLESAMDKEVRLSLYDGENLAFLLGCGEHILSSEYRYISFFPWKGEAEVSLNGFKYPLSHYILQAKQPIGVSNEPSGSPKITVHDGVVLCICIEKHQEEL